MPYLLVVVLAIAACQAVPAFPPPAAASPGVPLAASPAVPIAAVPSPEPAGSAGPTSTPTPTDTCPPTASKSRVNVRGQRIPVDLAFTNATRTRGLSGRPCLARGTGLVLGWDVPTFARIWMPEMNFPIDVIFVRAGKVVMVYADAQPCAPGGPCPTFGPDGAVDYVLEVPAGSAKEWGVVAGDPIELTR